MESRDFLKCNIEYLNWHEKCLGEDEIINGCVSVQSMIIFSCFHLCRRSNAPYGTAHQNLRPSRRAFIRTFPCSSLLCEDRVTTNWKVTEPFLHRNYFPFGTHLRRWYQQVHRESRTALLAKIGKQVFHGQTPLNPRLPGKKCIFNTCVVAALEGFRR